jgi:hypothetical protein
MSIADLKECNGVIDRNSSGGTTFTISDSNKNNQCVAAIEHLTVTNASLQELREEYRRLKRAYTPLNLLMERARDIPLESVWPGRVASTTSYGPRKEDLQELVQAAVDKAMSGRK